MDEPEYDSAITGKAINRTTGAVQQVVLPAQTVTIAPPPVPLQGNIIQDICKSCGCVVANKEVHTEWHKKISDIYPY